MNEKNIDNPIHPADQPEENSQAVVTPEVSRARLFFRKTIRWSIGILILIGLGFLFAVFTLYVPNRKAIQDKDAILRQANQELANLKAELNALKDTEKKRQNIQDDLNTANMHVVMLNARLDIANAQLAMANSEPEMAHLSLAKTEITLSTLGISVTANQRKIVSDLQSRLRLVKSEIDSNPYAAQSDLDVLATGLLELEKTYFPAP